MPHADPRKGMFIESQKSSDLRDISGDGCIERPAGFEYRALERSDVATERLM